MSDEPDFTDSWSPELLKKALKTAEDAAFGNLAAALKMRDALAQAKADRTSKATDSNRAKGDTNEAKAKRMRAEGKSVAVIARDLHLTQRWISRLLKRK